MESLPPPETLSCQELQDQIRTLEEQLIQSQRLASLGELTSTATHEFNNVLMTIINYAKLGLRNKDESNRTKAFDKILAAANRASKITNTILATAKNRKQVFAPTNFVSLVTDSLLLLEKELSKYRIAVEKSFPDNEGYHVDVDSGDSTKVDSHYVDSGVVDSGVADSNGAVPDIMADGNQIQQVILNLIINARQAMPNGGRLILKICYDEENEMLDFVVRDFGVGISQDKLPKIFEPFYTSKSGPDESGKGGTGLGLSTCKSIIERHQGSIRVESTEGKGTAFTIKLPTVIRAKLLELKSQETK